MVHTGTNIIARLTKRQVERLLGDYDDDPVDALSAALRVVLDMPHADWAALLAAAPLDATRLRLLLDGDASSLDQLAAELNERRGLIR